VLTHALSLYRHARERAYMRLVWGLVMGRSQQLLDLVSVAATCTIDSRHALGGRQRGAAPHPGQRGTLP